MGRAISSSSTIWQARSTLMLSPSGKTIRLGALFARCDDPAHDRVLRAADAALQPLAVLVEVERAARATPDSIAASATAGAHHQSTRVSNGLGMM